MIHARYAINGLHLQTWEMSSKPHYASQDSLIINEGEQRLRACVFDGLTPHKDCPSFLNMDGAQYAALLAHNAARQMNDLEQTLIDLNSYLYTQNQHLPARAHPSCMIAACDITHDGTARMINAGDSEIWVKSQDTWEKVAGGNKLTHEAALEARQWFENNPGASLDDVLAWDTTFSSRDEVWVETPLGMFQTLKYSDITISNWQAIMIASDGARLDQANALGQLDTIDQWLTSLRSFEASGGDGVHMAKPSDDVSLILIEKENK